MDFVTPKNLVILDIMSMLDYSYEFIARGTVAYAQTFADKSYVDFEVPSGSFLFPFSSETSNLLIELSRLHLLDHCHVTLLTPGAFSEVTRVAQFYGSEGTELAQAFNLFLDANFAGQKTFSVKSDVIVPREARNIKTWYVSNMTTSRELRAMDRELNKDFNPYDSIDRNEYSNPTKVFLKNEKAALILSRVIENIYEELKKDSPN